jgi:hypothetical protein
VALHLAADAWEHLLAKAERIVEHAALLGHAMTPKRAGARHEIEQLFGQTLHVVQDERAVTTALCLGRCAEALRTAMVALHKLLEEMDRVVDLGRRPARYRVLDHQLAKACELLRSERRILAL